MSCYDLVTGDTGSTLRVTCTDNDTGAVINLTGATVKVKWDDAQGAYTERTAVIENAAQGIVTYQFQSGEIFAPEMNIDAEITDSSGKTISICKLISLKVRERVA